MSAAKSGFASDWRDALIDVDFRGPRGPLRHLGSYSDEPVKRLDEQIADAWYLTKVAEARETKTIERANAAKAKHERAVAQCELAAEQVRTLLGQLEQLGEEP